MLIGSEWPPGWKGLIENMVSIEILEKIWDIWGNLPLFLHSRLLNIPLTQSWKVFLTNPTYVDKTYIPKNKITVDISVGQSSPCFVTCLRLILRFNKCELGNWCKLWNLFTYYQIGVLLVVVFGTLCMKCVYYWELIAITQKLCEKK